MLSSVPVEPLTRTRTSGRRSSAARRVALSQAASWLLRPCRTGGFVVGAAGAAAGAAAGGAPAFGGAAAGTAFGANAGATPFAPEAAGVGAAGAGAGAGAGLVAAAVALAAKLAGAGAAAAGSPAAGGAALAMVAGPPLEGPQRGQTNPQSLHATACKGAEGVENEQLRCVRTRCGCDAGDRRQSGGWGAYVGCGVKERQGKGRGVPPRRRRNRGGTTGCRRHIGPGEVSRDRGQS